MSDSQEMTAQVADPQPELQLAIEKAADNVGEAAVAGYEQIGGKAREGVTDLLDVIQQWKKRLIDDINQQPLLSTFVAALVGLLVGAMFLPRKRN